MKFSQVKEILEIGDLKPDLLSLHNLRRDLTRWRRFQGAALFFRDIQRRGPLLSRR
jgi:hypothetical protein